MDVERPGPGEELNEGDATTPRVAATIILLRGGASALEVLLVRRTPQARFMGGVWVFPGGAVDPGEDLRDAAARELREEASVSVADHERLVPFSRWITPAQVKIRFDTHFFLAAAPDDAQPAVDGSECVDVGWFAPRDALERYSRDEMPLVFPTIKHLQQLGAFATADELLAYARGREVQPVEPRVVMHGETARILLPGEPGYET
jgi:8-oxo-dGTP pyrophosphatase MutT (NUDIX family)